MSDFKNLCVSSGGVHVFQFLGCLAFISEVTDLTKVKRYVGTSVGAMLCFFLAIGYTPMELLLKLMMSKIWNLIKHANLMDMLQGDGAFHWGPFAEELETCTIEKIGKLPTLKGLLDDFGAHLTCMAYNLTEHREEALSPETHPDLPCLTALRMTSGIPFFFSSFRYDGSEYCDGAVVNSFPFSVLEGQEQTIALCLDGRPKSQGGDNKGFNMMSYALNILNAGAYAQTRSSVAVARDQPWTHLILFDSSGIEGFDFNLDTPQKLNMFSAGYTSAREQFMSLDGKETPVTPPEEDADEDRV